ncbi:MAG TPA: hypothetical protein VFA11_13050 [Acidimicrobiales bacterium]|nr:hypothetical protein [Acidimicrobiales bacterium]
MAETSKRSTSVKRTNANGSGASRARRVFGPRAAAEKAVTGGELTLTVPFVGDVTLPPPVHLAWYAAVATLAVAEVIEWPVALLLGVGRALADNRHSETLREFGEGLEQA